jgi:Secretion system C-terminal sorting domain
MKRFTGMLLFVLCGGGLLAQIAQPLAVDQPQVVSSSGGFLKNSGGSVSFTVGESMIPTYTATTDILTLGFQQDTPPLSDSLGELRSVVDGRWVASSTWQVFSGYAWVPASMAPDQQTPLAVVLNHVTVDTVVSAGKVAVNSGGLLDLNNLFTINPVDSTPILTVNANGILQVDAQGDLLSPNFSIFPPTVNLYGGTLNINGGVLGSLFVPAYNFSVQGNGDSNGVRSQININNSFVNSASLQMNTGTIHWYGGSINGPSITSTAGVINNDSFAIVTTPGVPMYFNEFLDNRKTLVIDTAAGQPRSSVIIASSAGSGNFNNRDTATTTIIGDTLQIDAPSDITGAIALHRKGVLYLNNPYMYTQFNVAVLGNGSLIFNPFFNPFGAMSFPGQDTITLVGCLAFDGALNLANQSMITVVAPGCGVSTDTLALDPGSTLQTVGGFTVNSYFNWGPDGESLTGSDSFTIASTATADFNSAHGYNQIKIINNGTINWTAGSIAGIADSAFPGGTIINNGVINAILPAGGSNLVMTDQTIQNNGAIYVSGTGSGQLQFNKQYNAGTQFNNNTAGRVVVQSGMFERGIPGLESGVDSVDAGAVYQVGVTGLSFVNPLYYNGGSILGNNMQLAGSVAQALNGSGFIDSLAINNVQGITLGGNQVIQKNLTLTRGNIKLNSYNLVVSDSAVPGQAQLQGGSLNSYVIADGGGFLEREVTNTGSAIVFPIGTVSSYIPATVSLEPGSPNYTLGVSLYDSVYSAYNGSDLPVGAAVTIDAVGRTWVLRPFRTTGTGTPSATVTLQWNPADETSGFVRTGSLQLAHYTGGAWDPGPDLTVAGDNPYSVSRSGLTSFSPFGIFSGGTPLPITLLDFTGRTTPSGNLLQWQTSSELNNDHFVVQRSGGSGGNFSALGTVAGNGTSSIVNDYQYLDSAPLAGNNFYRLQQVDRDGNVSYSPIILLGGTGESTLTLYPNPATTELNFVLPSNVATGNAQVNIYDGTGQLVQSEEISTGIAVLPLNISLLKPGSYTVTLFLADSRLQGRFIKL